MHYSRFMLLFICSAQANIARIVQKVAAITQKKDADLDLVRRTYSDLLEENRRLGEELESLRDETLN